MGNGNELAQGERIAQSAVAERGLAGADARLVAFILLVAADFVAVWAGCLVAFELAHSQADDILGFAVPAAVYLAAAGLAGAYSRQAFVSPLVSALAAVRAIVFSSAIIWAVAVLSGHWQAEGIGDMALAVGVAAVLAAAGRTALAFLVGLFAGKLRADLLIIDDVEPPLVPAHYAVTRASTIGLSEKSGNNPVGLVRLARLGARVDRVLVSCSEGRRRFWAESIRPLGLDAGVIVEDVAQLSAFDTEFETTLPVLRISRGPLAVRQRIAKRLFDLVLSVPLFIALSPVFAALCIGIPLTTGRRRIFEKQMLLGMRNEVFTSHVFVAPGRPRLERFLRSSGLGRLPALLDVVLGHMSLVGPGPIEAVSRASAAGPPRRRNVKPGLFAPVTQPAGRSYREGWTLWRDVASIMRGKLTQTLRAEEPGR